MEDGSLNGYLERYLNHLRLQGLSERTIKITRSSVGRFLKYLEENRITDITQATKQILSDYSLKLLLHRGHRGKSVKTKPYNASSRMNMLCALKSFFRFLKKENVIVNNPAAEMTLPKVPRTLSRDIPTPEEVAKILSSLNEKSKIGLRDRAIIETLYGTGIRSPELTRLKLEDIDFENKFLTIRKGKNGRPRTVPLSPTAVSALKEYLENARTKFLEDPEKDDGWLFLSTRDVTALEGRRGTPLGVVSVNAIVQSAALKAGLKKHLIPHSFRYACATHMMRNGADIRFIQELLGHKSLLATQGYTRVVKGDLKRMIHDFHPRGEINDGK